MRKAAQKATGSFAAQLTDSDSDGPTPSGASDAFPSPKKGKSVVTYNRKGRTIASSKSKGSVARTTAGARRKSTKTAEAPSITQKRSKSTIRTSSAKRRRLSSSPLSSATESDKSRASSEEPPSTTRESPRKRAPSSSTSLSELSFLESSRASIPPAKAPMQRPRVFDKTVSRLSIFSSQNLPSASVVNSVSIEDEWDIRRLGSVVWVRIDQHGEVTTEEVGDENDASTAAIWWPGRIMNEDTNDTPLHVSLFGKPSTYASDAVEIDKPSPNNILSMHCSKHTLRFNSNTFTLARPLDGFRASPHKKQKTELQKRWSEAVSQMISEDAEDNDGLVSVSSLFTYAGTSATDSFASNSTKTKASASTTTLKSKTRALPYDSDSDLDLELDRWSPPPPDSLLEIPGELVLARESTKKTEYWPAKVMAYIPPPRPTVKPKYELLYLDSAVIQVTRDLFFTCEDPEFMSCKLGEFESATTLDDAHNDDAADADEADPTMSNSHPDLPPPSLPPPSRTEFCELSIPAQFAYVKPILALIMAEKYEPAKARHDAFMKGGAARVNVCRDAAAKGDMTAVEVAQLRKCLTRWLLNEHPAVGEEDTVRSPDHAGASGPSARPIDVDLAQEPVADTEPAQRQPSNDVLMDAGASVPSSPPVDMDSTRRPAVESSEPEVIPSSPVEMPPSSFTVTDDQEADDKLFSPTDRSGETESAEEQGQLPSMERQTSCQISLGAGDVAAPIEEHEHLDHARKTPSFDSLSGVEKVEYCSNVLLPEATVQLMLWRWEKRSTLEPEDAEEEANLHRLGLEKAEETDWVHDVLRLRQAKEKSRLNKAGSAHPPKSSSKGLWGTRSRPRNVS
ncbi:hypothetical protein OE88DRAFT_1687381 [Heliocybe sulcata]|uniref:Uncharacterized protein n=1 Tax=Heliocybe sulcata TaxID=5364 RepID=A0A5C3MMJ1_9AGAM|nr:hypothetical protein OE88DRAFT_1687381 [Heliocybe sulcata]